MFPNEEASVELDNEDGSLWDDGDDDDAENMQEESGADKLVMTNGKAHQNVIASGTSAILENKRSQAKSGQSRTSEQSGRLSRTMGSTSNSADIMGRVVKLIRHGGLFQSNPRLCCNL